MATTETYVDGGSRDRLDSLSFPREQRVSLDSSGMFDGFVSHETEDTFHDVSADALKGISLDLIGDMEPKESASHSESVPLPTQRHSLFDEITSPESKPGRSILETETEHSDYERSPLTTPANSSSKPSSKRNSGSRSSRKGSNGSRNGHGVNGANIDEGDLLHLRGSVDDGSTLNLGGGDEGFSYLPSGASRLKLFANRIYFSKAYTGLYLIMIFISVFIVLGMLLADDLWRAWWVLTLEILLNGLFAIELGIRMLAKGANFWKSWSDVVDFLVLLLCLLLLFAFYEGPTQWEEAEELSDSLILGFRYGIQYLRLASTIKGLHFNMTALRSTVDFIRISPNDETARLNNFNLDNNDFELTLSHMGPTAGFDDLDDEEELDLDALEENLNLSS